MAQQSTMGPTHIWQIATSGPQYRPSIPKFHEFWSTNALKLDRHFTLQ